MEADTVYYALCSSDMQTQNVHQTLVQCWATVCEAGPALNQLWTEVSVFLGMLINSPAVCDKSIVRNY